MIGPDMNALIIRPVANGYIVTPSPDENRPLSLNCTTPDSEVHVFNTPGDLADYINLVAGEHEKTRDAAEDLREALDA